MKKPRYLVLDWLAYLGLRTISMVMHWFPVNVNLGTARLFGTFWYYFDKRHTARALTNLQRSFPHLSEAERKRIAYRSVQHMFMMGVEVFFTTRLIRIDTWRKYVRIDDIQKVLGLLMDPSRGLIMLTGHYGNWEILGYVMATLGFETTSVARPLDNPIINDWMFGVRERHGQKVLRKKGATTEITQLLDDRRVVAFVADQNAGSKGIFVDFFGRKASTYKSIGLLAMHYEVPIVVGFARRLKDRFQFQLAMQDVIWPEDWKKENDPLRYITQRYTKAIESFVSEVPDQYLWVHRRWRSRPKGETALAYD
jgi:Kdo2-lipid IVA lauroyltransferase/acyltransferase